MSPPTQPRQRLRWFTRVLFTGILWCGTPPREDRCPTTPGQLLP